MSLLEIIVIIASVSIVLGVIITTIINKKKGKSSCGCDCSSCSSRCSCKTEKNDKTPKN